jgi:hypothetical protein
MRALILVAPLCLAMTWVLRSPSTGKAGGDTAITAEGLGTGPTKEEAEKSARERAIDNLVAKLDPSATWPGAPDFIREHATMDTTKPGVQAIDPPIAGERFKTTVTMRLSTSDYQELMEKDRSTRAAQRHSAILPGFTGLVLLLGSIGVYHRLTRRTKV